MFCILATHGNDFGGNDKYAHVQLLLYLGFITEYVITCSLISI